MTLSRHSISMPFLIFSSHGYQKTLPQNLTKRRSKKHTHNLCADGV